MSVIVQKDNGTELIVTITDDQGIVDLTTATSITAHFVLRDGKYRSFDKTLTVDDALSGTCSTILTSEDLRVSGTYLVQLTVTFPGGGVFSSNLFTLAVDPLLRRS